MVLSKYVVALNDPRVFLNPISYARAHMQTIPIQPIALEYIRPSCVDIFLFLKYFFLSITVFSIRYLTFSSSVKPDKICVAILHVQTHAGNIDVSCWIVVVSGSDVPISVVSTVASGLMVVSMIVVCDRCVGFVKIPVFGITCGSCDSVWKFDDVMLLYLL